MSAGPSMRRIFAIIACITIACASAPTEPDPPGSTSPPPPPPPSSAPALRLLFLGNSLTYTHDVPRLVAQLAVAAGRREPAIVTRAEANYALEDHWNDGTARGVLRTGNFTFVIMQQGPSTQPDSRVHLIEWVRTWSDEARIVGTQPAVYGVWPPTGGDIDAGITNHADAAAAANARLFPVAAVWRAVRQADATVPLAGPDGFHQSAHGAWLAAAVITVGLYDVPVASLVNLFPSAITPSQEATMKAAMRAVLQRD